MLVRLETARADLHASAAGGLGKRRPLEVGVLALISRWVEFGRTDAI